MTPSPVDATEWLTPREAATELRVHYRTVLEAVATDQLPHVRVGRAIRIPRAALEPWRATAGGGTCRRSPGPGSVAG